MDLAGGVANRSLHLAAGLLGSANRGGKVSRVVERVEDAQDIDAVLNRLLHKGLDDIVRIIVIAQKVLAAQQHLQLGVLHMGANGAQALPGILVQKAQARIERRAAPNLKRLVTAAIEGFQNGNHILDGHARRDLALLAVAQDGLHKANLMCHGMSRTSYLYRVSNVNERNSLKRPFWAGTSWKEPWTPGR